MADTRHSSYSTPALLNAIGRSSHSMGCAERHQMHCTRLRHATEGAILGKGILYNILITPGLHRLLSPNLGIVDLSQCMLLFLRYSAHLLQVLRQTHQSRSTRSRLWITLVCQVCHSNTGLVCGSLIAFLFVNVGGLKHSREQTVPNGQQHIVLLPMATAIPVPQLRNVYGCHACCPSSANFQLVPWS